MRTSWMQHVRRALVAPGNLVIGAGALACAAVAWNPLPLVLFALGEPVWLYRAGSRDEVDDARREAIARGERARTWLRVQLDVLLRDTPCGAWTRAGLLPDYATRHARLVETRDQAAHMVAVRAGAARSLEEDIVLRLDDMLRAHLAMARERLLFHCALAKVYPQLPAPPRELAWTERVARALVAPAPDVPAPWTGDVRFVSLDAALAEVEDRTARFEAELARDPARAPVYRPILETLARRRDELARRGANDRDMAAQLEVFPDQFELILSQLATSRGGVAAIVGEMTQLLEQTDDAVGFAEELRAAERDTLGALAELE